MVYPFRYFDARVGNCTAMKQSVASVWANLYIYDTKYLRNGGTCNMKLWGGRFTKETNKLVHNFNASLSFDQKFYEEVFTGIFPLLKCLLNSRLSLPMIRTR